MTLIFLNYALIIKNFKELELSSQKKLANYLLLLSLPLILAYNALSYDVFNYIFNGKILVHYKANPHVKVALDYPNDSWTRFMNNTHTAAPYGYGWTTISVIPYILGLGKFLTTWISFKLFSLLAFFISLVVLTEILEKEKVKQRWQKMAILFLNPLFLIEFLGNAHNDLWMIWPALLAIYYAKYRKRSFLIVLFSFILISFSISIKFSTILLIPFIIYSLYKDQFKKIKIFSKIYQLVDKYYYDLASLLMFLPLFTERSRHFLPWYLSWSLIFYPLLKNKIWKEILIVFSISSISRYIPWLIRLPWMSFGQDMSSLVNQQKIITWIIPAIYLLIKAIIFLFNRNSEK
jgi:hypothetical protein